MCSSVLCAFSPNPQIFMCRIFLYIQKQFNMSLHVLSTPRGPPARKSSHFPYAFLFPSCTVQFGSSFGFALKFFLFSARPPQKSVNLMVNLLLLLFHPHPHPRRLLFAPSYTYVCHDGSLIRTSVMMELQVTPRRQRILVGTGHPVGDFSGRYRYCSEILIGNFSLPVLLL